MSETYTPPKTAINNAKRGLDLRKKYGRGGLTPAEAKSYGIDSGITRAKRISKGKLSRHDVRRMSAFNRHRQNYNPSKKMGDGGPTAGTIAWLLWGGTSGVNWAKKKSAAMNAESFEAEGGRWGKGNLKLSNSEITQLLLYENWKCSNCDNSIKNKQNIPFSEEEKNDLTWTIFAPEYDLQNYDDINIVTKGIRGTKGNVVKLEDGTLNFDNLHVLCNGCGQRKKIGRAVTLSFRTSKEKKEWLKSLAKDKNKGMAEIMSDVIDEYRNNYEAESFEADDIICICGCDGVMQDHDDRGYGVWECMICRNDSDKDYGFPCSDCEPKNDLKNAEDEIYDYTCLLILKIRDANKDYPLYARLKDGEFALNPLALIKIKEFILSGLNLNGVDYSGTTITADSVIFKFNFNILDDAEEFSKYVNQFISITFAENHDEIPDNELCPHCMFSEVTITVVDKYEVGIEIASLMDWSDKELTINFLEYLFALENVDMEYTLNLLRERGADIDIPNVVGNSLNELIDIEKDGYESMLEYIINELKNKKRDIDIVAFTLSADNGLKQQIISTMLEMQKIDSRQLSSRLEKQFYFNQGKLQGVEDFLYYFYSDSDKFIFDNI